MTVLGFRLLLAGARKSGHVVREWVSDDIATVPGLAGGEHRPGVQYSVWKKVFSDHPTKLLWFIKFHQPNLSSSSG